ncbi:hypothetical protein ABTH30_24065, partial [Acinetobacter baumannii]
MNRDVGNLALEDEVHQGMELGQISNQASGERDGAKRQIDDGKGHVTPKQANRDESSGLRQYA